MSLVTRKLRGKIYYYFKHEQHKEIYLGTAEALLPGRVREALAYTDKRIDHYDEIRGRLLSLLPEEERRRLQARDETPTRQVMPAPLVQVRQSIHRGIQMKSFTRKDVEEMVEELSKELTKEKGK